MKGTMMMRTLVVLLVSTAAFAQITTEGLTAAPTGTLSVFPSQAPSVSAQPSVVPSSSPSTSPTYAPTLLKFSPSGSDFPSLVPSTSPAPLFDVNNPPDDETESSKMPSDFPSMVPSIQPTASPTGLPSDIPSMVPSLVPSKPPTEKPSVPPSDTPSLIPSEVPSETASDEPSSSPSILPSTSPSSSPSVEPSSRPSLLPSASPSTLPSAFPSDSPSTTPSVSPSAVPSTSPSVVPTSIPSFTPTESPTDHPTDSPTSAPTRQPSNTPSMIPSSMPTETCHDVRAYRSPINGFSCEDHEGTDCVQWRYLGLSIDEVESLIENCPVSCGVECGSALRFETLFSFKLWEIDTFLSPGAVTTLNEVAVEFMTEYISELEPDSTFFLYDTLLLSQQFAGNDAARNLRSLQGSATSSLLVDVEFRGYAISLEKVTIDKRLRDGLFSPQFTRALKRSGDETYKNTQVDVVGSTQPLQTSVDESGRSASPAGISAAVLGAFAVVAAAGYYFFQSKKTRTKNKAFVQENNAIFTNFPASPNQSVISPASSFTFDPTSNLVTRMARIVTSFSPRSTNNSLDEETTKAELTNSDSSDSNRELVTSHENLDVSNNMIEEGSERDEESYIEEVEVEEEHPYTGIIPPMIVIDRIDSDCDIYIEEGEGYSVAKVKPVVPSMRLEASSDLIAAMNDRSKPFDPATFSNFIKSNTPVEAEGSKAIPDGLAPIQGGGSSFNLFSSQDDDENDDNSTSKASNADTSDALFDRLREGDTSGLNTARLDLRGRNPFSIPFPSRPPRVPSEGSGPTQRSSPHSTNTTSPVLTREKSGLDGYHSDDNAAKERVSKRDMPGFLHSLWSKSPHNRGFPSGPKSDTSGESNNKPSRWGHRRGSSRGSYGTLGSLEDYGSILTFHAPKGQLGLVIECSTESAPIIAKVKDYSPLLDQVLPGDKIVMIDSTFTEKMGMSEVMSLLEGKSNRATSVRLKVFRASDGLDAMGNQLRSPTTSHLSFDGTSSVGTMSDQESPSNLNRKMSPSPLASLPTPAPSLLSGMKRSHSEAEIPHERDTE